MGLEEEIVIWDSGCFRSSWENKSGAVVMVLDLESRDLDPRPGSAQSTKLWDSVYLISQGLIFLTCKSSRVTP